MNEHVITHLLGHTIGLLHSDYNGHGTTCGGTRDSSYGLAPIHIPGTPTTSTLGGSLMNSCFRPTETGEFTSSDKTALHSLY